MVKKPKPAHRARGRVSRHTRTRTASRRRPLQIESLEQRTLLAGDLGMSVMPEGEGPDPLVAVRLNAVDPQTFQPLEAVHQGEMFVLLASVEDLRSDATGVFGAYLDLLYPSEFFSVFGNIPQAALVYASGFGNGTSGAVSAGLVDELGTFSASSTPPGPGEQMLAGVRLVATQTGDVQFTSNAADDSPESDILLFDRDEPVSTELVTYGDLSLQILPPLPEKSVDAIADFQVVNENSFENLFPVLQNDKNSTGSPLVISEVHTTNAHGRVEIANEGTLLVYTPDRGFAGTASFDYTIMADGERDTTTVFIQVQRAVSHEDQVAYELQITDPAGKPVSAVTVGDDFVLHATAEDLRDVPSGVFAAYLDVRYTSGSAEVVGPITYGPFYTNGNEGAVSVPGEIDEVGGFSNPTPLGGGKFEVFHVPFRATSPGRVIFGADPAENDPDSHTLLYDVDAPVAIEDIVFGQAALTVLPSVVAVDDTYEVSANGAAQTFAVLENDVHFGGGTLSVVSVDDAGLLGTVAVAPNGRGVTYAPPPAFGGSEQFTYAISSPTGSSTAQVTVHVQPTAALDDQLEIRLETTDLEGNVISSVGAGEDFLVRALVQDLRDSGDDRGVYAAYFDLLYERAGVHPVRTQAGPLGPAVTFGPEYQNGVRGEASVPGIFNEIGAFQTSSTPLGAGESLLFAARFRAATARGEADSFQISEDEPATFSVLDNDQPNAAVTTFRADPADDQPLSDSLFYEPVEAIPYDRIRYGSATLEIASGSGAATIAGVGPGSAGGSISIGDDGRSLSYVPASNFHGVETFSYSLDGQTHTEVSVTVLPVNDAPVGRRDSYRVRENRALTVGPNAGVLANDFDVDGGTLDAVLVNDVSHGTLQLASDGSFTYDPNENYLGRDSFTYVATDGQLESSPTTVEIEVVDRPVSIRMEALGASGEPIVEVAADAPLIVRTLVQDLRSPSEVELGLGAVYLDVAYDPDDITPRLSTGGPLGLAAEFGPAYPNGIRGEVLNGRLNDIGGFQEEFSALGGDELELFRLEFESQGPRVADDSYLIAGGASVIQLDVLLNEAKLRWNVTLDAQHAANSPSADVLYLDPVEPVAENDIRYENITLAVRNGPLTLQSVGETDSGAAVSFSNGVIDYQPAEGFIGHDSFTYTVVDRSGRTAIATVMLEVTESWQNPVQPTDVNNDGSDSPLDALLIMNELNSAGPQVLAEGIISAFLDVNGDGVVSPIDALLVINRLIENASSGEGESAPVGMSVASAPLVATRAVSGQGVSRPDGMPDLLGFASFPSRPAFDGADGSASEINADHSIATALEDQDFADLLDAVAKDVAPVWAAFP